MRINLQCPFQDKDLAKQRGARWDPKLRVWYVQDVADLGPFAAWLPRTPAETGQPAARAQPEAVTRAPSHPSRGTVSTSLGTRALALSGCQCAVLPWQDCDCTRRANAAIEA